MKTNLIQNMKPAYRKNHEGQDMWKVHTPKLLNEILTNNGVGILYRPIQIFARILFDLGETAARINDPELNKLMVRLTIYSCADPESPDYDKKLVDKILNVKTK